MVRLLTTCGAMTVFTIACSGKGVVTRQHMSVMQCVICLDFLHHLYTAEFAHQWSMADVVFVGQFPIR
ncbi:TPA: hypothetical protein MH291_25480 [Klebsiella pneumoniae]|nr:hypothetical protein [Klebsiella pneumoniae]